MDGELDATPWGSANVPDTLLVVGIVERVPRAAEGACNSRHLPTTACRTQKKKKTQLMLTGNSGQDIFKPLQKTCNALYRRKVTIKFNFPATKQ